jgi:hypothetical protein
MCDFASRPFLRHRLRSVLVMASSSGQNSRLEISIFYFMIVNEFIPLRIKLLARFSRLDVRAFLRDSLPFLISVKQRID